MNYLKEKLYTKSTESSLNTGCITFTQSIPVRGIPYRMICFLGMNHDSFPGKDSFMGFDLLGLEYQTGDRGKKETDKYLFLDTLLSAGEKLYLSYIGQSMKDNSEIPPSIVIDTLLDYIESACKDEFAKKVRNGLLIKHPLHGYSSSYQKDNERLFTYLYSQKPSGYSFKKKEENEIEEIQVYSLVKFFQAPVDWYFNSILGLVYEDPENTLNETELFELDNLQKWKIKEDLLKKKEGATPFYLNKGIKEGSLPLKCAGLVTLENLSKEIDRLKTTFIKLVDNREENKFVTDLEINHMRIKGTIDSVYDECFIVYSFSKSPLRHKIAAFIKSLLLFANGKITSAKFLGKDGTISEIPANRESAQSVLKKLLDWYKKGNRKPLLFTLKAAEASLKEESAIDDIRKAFHDEAYPGEYGIYPANPYLQILMEENRFENIGQTEFEEIFDIANELRINQF
jgi:exodeoxyribonuclease V gamma subunit